MKSNILYCLLALLFILSGCDNLGWDKTGYEITIYPEIIQHDQILSVESFLTANGFQTYRREMPTEFSRFEKPASFSNKTNMVQTNYTKTMSENPYDFIMVAIRYSKEADGNVSNVTIYFANRYIGTISKKMKTELTSLYNSFHHEFGNSLGPIRVETKEVAPPVSISNDVKKQYQSP